MTNPYLHCPFCLQEYDLLNDCRRIGDSDSIVELECKEHGTIIIITDYLKGKCSGGELVVRCPECNEACLMENLEVVGGAG